MRIILIVLLFPTLFSFSQTSCDGGVQILNLFDCNGIRLVKGDSALQIKQYLLNDNNFKVLKEIPNETEMQWRIPNISFTFHFIQPILYKEKILRNSKKFMLNQRLVITYKNDTMRIDFKNILPPNTIHWTIIDTLFFAKGNYQFDIKTNIQTLPKCRFNQHIDTIEMHKYPNGKSYYEINHQKKFINYKLLNPKHNHNSYYFRYSDINVSLDDCKDKIGINPPERNTSDYVIKINDIQYSGKITFGEIYDVCDDFIYNSRKHLLIETENIYYQGKRVESGIVKKTILSPYFMRGEHKVCFEKKLFQFAVILKNNDKANIFLSLLDSLKLTNRKSVFTHIAKNNSKDIYILNYADSSIDTNLLSAMNENSIDVNQVYKKVNNSREILNTLNYLDVWDILLLEKGRILLSKDELLIKWKPELDPIFIKSTLEKLNLYVESEKLGGVLVKFNKNNISYTGPFKIDEPYAIINIAMYLKEAGYVIFAEPITYSTLEEDK